MVIWTMLAPNCAVCSYLKYLGITLILVDSSVKMSDCLLLGLVRCLIEYIGTGTLSSSSSLTAKLCGSGFLMSRIHPLYPGEDA